MVQRKNKNELANLPDKKMLEDKAEALMKQFGVVGMGLSVWKDGKEFIHRGFGLLEINKAETVNIHTCFAIASMTKAFTAFIIYKLVELGIIASVDDPVQKYLPWFNLKDPYTSRALSIRTCLSHYSGYSRHDWMWYALGMQIEEIAHRFAYAQPKTGYREGFIYNNCFVSIGAMCAEAVTGKKWYDMVKEFILEPLGMKRTTFNLKDLKALDNVATPHNDYGHGQEPVEYKACDQVGAAASINSTIEALSKWMRMQLNGGMFDGMQLIKPELLNDMHTPQVTIKVSDPHRKGVPPMNFFGYSPGWFHESFRDQRITQHGGNMNGMTSLIAMIRAMNLGMTLLTNQGSSHLREAMMYTIFDAFLQAQSPGSFQSVDWGTAMLLRAKEQEKADAKKAKAEAKKKLAGLPPSLSLEKYVGTYESPVWDKLSVCLAKVKGPDGKEAEKLCVVLRGNTEGICEHKEHDSFTVHWSNRDEGESTIDFMIRQDTIESVECKDFEEAQFKRISDKPEKQPKLREIQPKARKARRHWYQSAYHH